MKRKMLFLVAFAVVAMLAFAACGGNDDNGGGGGGGGATADTPATTDGGGGGAASTDDGAGAATDNIIELRVLNYIDLTGAGATEEVAVIWDAFEAAHPHIRLIREDEFDESFHHAIEAYAAAGMLPDVMYAWPSGRSTTLHENRLLLDLMPLVQRDGLYNYLIPAVLDPSAQAGGYLAIIPQGITATNTFFVNMEVLDAVGLQPARTYSEMVAQVPILAEAGFETLLMANEATWVMQSCLFSLVAGRFMGEGWDERILSGQTTFEDPGFIAALAFIQQMYQDGVISPTTLMVDYGLAPGLFATNTAAYYIDGDWRVGAFITDSATGEALISPERQENFYVTVFPEIDLPGVVIPGRTNSVVLGVGWGINAELANDPERLEAAWTLVRWLIGEEVQSFRLRTGGLPNPSWAGIDADALPLEPLQVSLAGLGSEFDIATVVFDGSFPGVVYSPLNDGLQALGMGTTTPEAVAAIVQAAFEAWLDVQ
ncbi:MAG: extracellular solute-binding protein [Defluviitaleaceae bacterium]|nr:extracellular solute-binding protein [Defluviitaleaceae bacterium]